MPAEQLAPFVQRLRSTAPLGGDSVSTIFGLPLQLVSVERGQELYATGSRELPCYVIIEGSAIRYKSRRDGSKAIVSFELPGDLVNLDSLLLGRTECGVSALSATTLAVFEQDAIRQAVHRDRGLDVALWRYALVKAATLEEWLLNLGTRSPTGRIAHVLAELHARSMAVGTPAASAAELFIGPQELADAMGLQAVIVTRSLSELASRQVIGSNGDSIVILDIDRLSKIGGFRADYLHLNL